MDREIVARAQIILEDPIGHDSPPRYSPVPFPSFNLSDTDDLKPCLIIEVWRLA